MNRARPETEQLQCLATESSWSAELSSGSQPAGGPTWTALPIFVHGTNCEGSVAPCFSPLSLTGAQQACYFAGRALRTPGYSFCTSPHARCATAPFCPFAPFAFFHLCGCQVGQLSAASPTAHCGRPASVLLLKPHVACCCLGHARNTISSARCATALFRAAASVVRCIPIFPSRAPSKRATSPTISID